MLSEHSCRRKNDVSATQCKMCWLVPVCAGALWEDQHLLPSSLSFPFYTSLLHRVQSFLSRIRVCPVDQQWLSVPGISLSSCFSEDNSISKISPDEAAEERDIFCLSFCHNARGAHDSNRKGVKKCGVGCHTKDWGSLRRSLKVGS